MASEKASAKTSHRAKVEVNAMFRRAEALLTQLFTPLTLIHKLRVIPTQSEDTLETARPQIKV